MKIKINKNFKAPKWESNESGYLYEKRINAKEMYVTGGIGFSGQKVHRMRLVYLDTEDGLGIVNISCWCGAAKFNSKNIPYFDDDLSEVNCKKCLK